MTTPTTVQVRFQFRADTAANWTTIDPVLLANELGRETDTGKIKIGDGTTAWSSLAYQGWSTLTYPLVNADIASDAAIDHSKLADITAGSVLLGNASNVPTATALSGDVTVNSSGVTAISAGAIVDADVSASAEIAVSKLANGTANQILTTDGTDVTWTDSPTIAGNVIITGNLTVNGTETIINVDTLQVEDKTIEMGVVATPTDLTADGGGIVLKGASDKTITWSDTTDAWTSSEPLDLPAGAEATPALFFDGDVNSGLYSPGADQVAISTAGEGRLFVNSSGVMRHGSNAGGTYNGNITFAYNDRYPAIEYRTGNTVDGRLWKDVNGGNFLLENVTGSIVFEAANSEALRLTSTGEFEFTGAGTAGTTQAVYFSGSAPVDSLVVDSNGRLGVGASSPAYDLQVEGPSATVSIKDPNNNTGPRAVRLVYSFDDGDGAAINAVRASSEAATDVYLTFRTGGITNSEERLRITSDGYLRLAGGGLQFNGDTAAANALDDYEEGTWTPSYEPDTGAFTSITYDSLTDGKYTRIGNLVTCSFAIRTDAITIGTASGNLYISGLPFASSSTGASEAGSGTFTYSANFTGDVPNACLTQTSDTKIRLYYKTTANGNSGSSDVADLSTSTNANYIIGTISYFAA